MNHILTIVLLSFVSTFAFSQEEISSFFYSDLLQSGQINPAFSTHDRANFGFGSTYFHLDVRGPKFRDIVQRSRFLQTIARATNEINISTDASFNVFDVAFKHNDWDFRIGYNSNFSAFFNSSPDIGVFFTEGNGQSLGKSFDLGPELYIRNFSELYLGTSGLFSDQYRIGMNFKLIQGNFDISTTRSKFEFTTQEEFYQINVESDYLINTSYNDIDFSLRGLLPFSSLASDNIGVSGDFGIHYLGENWSVAASVLDMGFLTWRSNPKNYKTNGSYSFEGFTFDEISEDSISVEWEEIQELFEVTTTTNQYRTIAPVKFYLGGEYQLNRWTFGGLAYTEWKQERVLPSFAVNAKTTLWNFWEVGMMYGIKNNSYSNLGVSSIMSVGPITLYALSDNVIGIFLNRARTKLNIRFGANVDIKTKPKKEVPADS